MFLLDPDLMNDRATATTDNRGKFRDDVIRPGVVNGFHPHAKGHQVCAEFIIVQVHYQSCQSQT
jgi:hypothetical protein